MNNMRFLMVLIVSMFITVALSSCGNSATKDSDQVDVVADTVKSEEVVVANDQVDMEAPAEEVFVVVDEMPQFVGGEEARIKFITQNVKYPENARAKGIEGTVYVSFVVDKNGKISDVELVRGIGGGCDEEAIRVVKMFPDWIPGKQKGKDVSVKYQMPFKFTLAS